jgi:hypothetical protein
MSGVQTENLDRESFGLGYWPADKLVIPRFLAFPTLNSSYPQPREKTSSPDKRTDRF